MPRLSKGTEAVAGSVEKGTLGDCEEHALILRDGREESLQRHVKHSVHGSIGLVLFSFHTLAMSMVARAVVVFLLFFCLVVEAEEERHVELVVHLEARRACAHALQLCRRHNKVDSVPRQCWGVIFQEALGRCSSVGECGALQGL